MRFSGSTPVVAQIFRAEVTADPEDVGQGDVHMLVGKIHARNTCHSVSS